MGMQCPQGPGATSVTQTLATTRAKQAFMVNHLVRINLPGQTDTAWLKASDTRDTLIRLNITKAPRLHFRNPPRDHPQNRLFFEMCRV